MAGFDVIVCGSLSLDVMVAAPHLPSADETTIGTDWGLKCGGRGGNQAVASALAEARTAMIGRVGEDDFGQRLLLNLSVHEVDRSEVIADAQRRSGMSVAIVEYSGDFGAVQVSGANLWVDAASVSAGFARLVGAKVLVLQNEIPEAANLAAAKAGKAAGAMVLYNAAPMRPAPPTLLELVDVMVLNRREASVLSGVQVTGAASAERAVSALLRQVETVILSMAQEGAVLGRRGEPPVFLAAPITIQDADDVFVGALAAALARGVPVQAAATLAIRSAAAQPVIEYRSSF
jgi:ribokinase